MYPKLKTEPVHLLFNKSFYKIPRTKIAAAFAGSVAAKECMIKDLSGFSKVFDTSFSKEYQEAMPSCIEAANRVGNYATAETLDYFNPTRSTEKFIKEILEHRDNPYYPFFEE
jgi:hypothetical protein